MCSGPARERRRLAETTSPPAHAAGGNRKRYSPLRNLIPRTQGQGTSHRAKVMTSISGALPGQLGTPGNRMSIPELPSGGGIAGNNWPNQLPASGSQSSVDVDVP